MFFFFGGRVGVRVRVRVRVQVRVRVRVQAQPRAARAPGKGGVRVQVGGACFFFLGCRGPCVQLFVNTKPIGRLSLLNPFRIGATDIQVLCVCDYKRLAVTKSRSRTIGNQKSTFGEARANERLCLMHSLGDMAK